MTNANDDDPFSMFSDEDDEEESDEGENSAEVEPSQRIIAQSLLASANSRLREGPPEAAVNRAPDGSTLGEEERWLDLSQFQLLELPWAAPLYKSPDIQLVSSLAVGGGRGFIATRRIPAGTLLLVEEPIMEWHMEQIGKKLELLSVRHILEHEKAPMIVQDLEHFHPTKRDVDSQADEEGNKEQISTMMQLLQSQSDEDQVAALVALAKSKKVHSKDLSPILTTDILRLLLALRYNGLESGVYRFVAMFNHKCHPNCTKLLPSGPQNYSEVRSTRVVDPGESLTISYVSRILSHASRRRYLWDQHRFDIGADLKGDELKMELIGGTLPASSIMTWSEDSLPSRIERATEELEQMYQDIASDMSDGLATSQVWETTKALEQSSLELFRQAKEQLRSDKHVLLIPILLLHVEATDAVLKAPSLATPVQLGIITRQVQSAIQLRNLQSLFSGIDHFDLARTNLDLANAIRELLTRSPKWLIDLKISTLGTFEAWSKFEHIARKEHERIKSLYPHDAANLVNENPN